MAVYMKNYRANKQEYYEKEKANDNNKYQNDPEYRENKKKKALERYYRLKAQKEQTNSIQVN
jgi:hypothetical protein